MRNKKPRNWNASFLTQKLIDFRFRHLYLKLLTVASYKQALKMRHAMIIKNDNDKKG